MVLFLCSLGRLRSRTGELLCLFGGLDARCAGTAKDAWAPVTDTLLRQADLVVCMEPEHQKALRNFAHYDPSKVMVLGIPDVHDRLAPVLVEDLVYQMKFRAPKVGAAMERGADLLADLPGYVEALGTQDTGSATNPAFAALPQ